MMALSGSLITLACACGAALLGMLIASRLPAHHLSAESKDIVKVIAALIGTLAALVLGLLTASAKGSFDSKINGLRHAGAQTILLDRLMAQYGTEAKEARDLLHQLAELRIRQLWIGRERTESEVQEAIARGPGIEAIQRRLLDLTPSSDAQRMLRASALRICDEIAETRWSGLLDTSRSIRWPFIAILVFWISTIFASFGLLAPHNATVITLLFVGALSISGSILLILALDQPFGALIGTPRGPAELVLKQLGQP